MPERKSFLHRLSKAMYCGAACLVVSATPAISQIHYVSPSGSHIEPYDSWATAATNIQDAISACVSGETVLVTNGVYTLSSGIIVTNDITIQSVGGAKETVIDGGGVVRCLKLTGLCTVEGFTIQNGYTSNNGGGVYCADTNSVVSNCTITGCRALEGGGGMYGGQASFCSIKGNTATQWGGGLRGVKAYRCNIEGNHADHYGGGAVGNISHCILTGNTAGSGGGAVSNYSQVRSSIITHNVANSDGGGSHQSTLINCIVMHNRADGVGGGMAWGVSYNCIVNSNTDTYAWQPSNFAYTTIQNTCSPSVTHGSSGNITNDPMLVGFHIATNSPCRGAGDSAFAVGTDFDDEPWANPPSIGIDENLGYGTVTGEVFFTLAGRNPTVAKFETRYSPIIMGPVTHTVLNFGNGLVVTNSRPWEYYTTSWPTDGPADVILTAFNDSYPSGTSLTQTVEVISLMETAIHVSADTGEDVNDGLSWSTAKRTIQAGVAAQSLLGGAVLVTNGIYNLADEIVIDKQLRLLSVNGSAETIIDGGTVTRCLRLSEQCFVEGFTIRNGNTDGDGGGVYCEDPGATVIDSIVTMNVAGDSGGGMYSGLALNCVILGNQAHWYGGGLCQSVAENCSILGNRVGNRGGGASGSTLVNCMVVANRSTGGGGGLFEGHAKNCTLTANRAGYDAGGLSDATAENCIIYYNVVDGSSRGYPDVSGRGDVLHSCVSRFHRVPSTSLTGSITNAPLLLSASHISTNSPCRGAGNSTYSEGTDIDGEPWADPPSMGCDENGGYGGVTGEVSFLLIGPTQVVADVQAEFYPYIIGPVTGTVIDFDNGLVATNSIGAHMTSWSAPGWHDIVLTTFNDDHPGGITHTASVQVVSVSLIDTDNDGMPDEFELQHIGDTTNLVASANEDFDPLTNLEEYIAGTDPTNSASFFQITSTGKILEGYVIQWDSVSNRIYDVGWTHRLAESGYRSLAADLAYPQGSYTDTVHGAEGAGFYDVKVRLDE